MNKFVCSIKKSSVHIVAENEWKKKFYFFVRKKFAELKKILNFAQSSFLHDDISSENNFSVGNEKKIFLVHFNCELLMIESNTLSRQNWILLNGFARFILKDCHGLKIEIYLLNSLNFRITRNKCKKETQESILNSFHVENQPPKKCYIITFKKPHDITRLNMENAINVPKINTMTLTKKN